MSNTSVINVPSQEEVGSVEAPQAPDTENAVYEDATDAGADQSAAEVEDQQPVEEAPQLEESSVEETEDTSVVETEDAVEEVVPQTDSEESLEEEGEVQEEAVEEEQEQQGTKVPARFFPNPMGMANGNGYGSPMGGMGVQMNGMMCPCMTCPIHRGAQSPMTVPRFVMPPGATKKDKSACSGCGKQMLIKTLEQSGGQCSSCIVAGVKQMARVQKAMTNNKVLCPQGCGKRYTAATIEKHGGMCRNCVIKIGLEHMGLTQRGTPKASPKASPKAPLKQPMLKGAPKAGMVKMVPKGPLASPIKGPIATATQLKLQLVAKAPVGKSPIKGPMLKPAGKQVAGHQVAKLVAPSTILKAPAKLGPVPKGNSPMLPFGLPKALGKLPIKPQPKALLMNKAQA